MKLVLILIVTTVVLTTILCLWLNSGDKDNKNKESITPMI